MTGLPRVVGINHVALEVGDLEEALSFYGKIFELELRGRAPRMAFIEIGDQFIVIPGNVNDACAFAGFAQDFLDDVIVLLRPVTAAPHRPDVDQVAHDVERFKIMLA